MVSNIGKRLRLFKRTDKFLWLKAEKFVLQLTYPANTWQGGYCLGDMKETDTISMIWQTAFLSLTHFTSALGSKIVLSSKCQQKQSSSGSTVHNYLTIGKVSKCWDFTVLWLVQKIDTWLELTSSITFIWLLVASQRTVPRSFRGKYAASFSLT